MDELNAALFAFKIGIAKFILTIQNFVFFTWHGIK